MTRIEVIIKAFKPTTHKKEDLLDFAEQLKELTYCDIVILSDMIKADMLESNPNQEFDF
jgi:hypothetical protein